MTAPSGRPRRPLSDQTLESALLGALLVDPRALDEVEAILQADDFHTADNMAVYSAIVQVAASGAVPSPSLLLPKLTQIMGQYAPAVLGRLIRAAGPVSSAGYMARKLQKLARIRRLAMAVADSLRELRDDDEIDDPDFLAARISKRIDQSVLQKAPDLTPIEIIHDQALEQLRRGPEERNDRIWTGLVQLDSILGGLRKGQLVIIGARTSEGKSALALNIAAHAAIEQKAGVLYFSLEMPAQELVRRLWASYPRIPMDVLSTEELAQSEIQRLERFRDKLAQSGLAIDDRPNQKADRLAAAARLLAKSQNVRLIVVDYLQLVLPDDPSISRERQVAEISRKLKLLAMTAKATVLCCAQLNRQADAGSPRLSHLRESGAVEQDADVVALIENKDPARSQKAVIHVPKNRNGPHGRADVAWIGRFVKFADLEIRYDDNDAPLL